MRKEGKDECEAFARQLGMQSRKTGLLEEAFTHRSYLNEHPDWPHAHNERLEYLGDAVLELAVSEHLFQKFPQAPEGELTVLRASLVNYQILARVAAELDLGKYIHMSRSEMKDTGRAREVILANAFEALVGALYLEESFVFVERFVLQYVVTPHIEEILKTKSYRDPKSELQELAQEKERITPIYRILSESGPAHNREFRAGAYIGEELVGEGMGPSKQEAEVAAAKAALTRILPKKQRT